ncbi:hypothetical protein NDU88_001169 [Pleurodeles waltl]|uniref:Uncharacterized protein n=1 Tax=Pleurodeles waltl TaxID=8319 RepID=A0AAV7V9M2_PLEWA|nr:hypothetical protein NDU88_001169 [Pleurodeles waltl]
MSPIRKVYVQQGAERKGVPSVQREKYSTSPALCWGQGLGCQRTTSDRPWFEVRLLDWKEVPPGPESHEQEPALIGRRI